MPEICRFFGIVIAMYYKEHTPPHFHAKPLSKNILSGDIPKRHKEP